MGGLAAAGDLVLPTHGAVGLLTRAGRARSRSRPVLLATGFAHPAELRQLRRAGRPRAACVPASRGSAPVTRPAVSVVMPFAGSRADAARALAALLGRCDAGPGDELILADNSGDRARARRASQVVLAAAEHSPSHARNVGAEHASRGTGSCSSTPTVCAEPGLIDALLRRRRSTPTSARSPARWSPRPTAPSLAARYGATRSFLGQSAHLAHPYMPRAVAANLLVRRAAFEQVGRLLRGGAGRRGHRLQLAPAARRLARWRRVHGRG